MPLDAQANLLRVLQEGEVLRIGGKKVRSIDVRVIAATHRNLFQAVENGSFRQDLYYRLNVLPVTVPSLRERKNDIPVLANFFLTRFAEALKRPVKRFAPEALDCLVAYDWPGNVRELENIVERTVNTASRQYIDVESLPPEVAKRAHLPSDTALAAETDDLSEAEARILAQALNRFDGNIRTAARHLRISRTTFYNKLRKYNICLTDIRGNGAN
jgi:transcriptional regulator with PAS, ATPase and Fis domain